MVVGISGKNTLDVKLPTLTISLLVKQYFVNARNAVLINDLIYIDKMNIKFQKNKIYVPYAISKFDKHEQLRDTLLNLIENQSSSSYGEISKTDWNIDVSEEKEYWRILKPHLNEHMKFVLSEINPCFDINSIDYVECWFQQYEKNDNHYWHIHPGCSYSSVYFLELDKENPVTSLLDADNLVIDNVVSEGDILTFPGSLIHCSVPNKSTKRKTVVVFNIF